MWMLAFGHHEDRTPAHGYAATREAAMARSPRAGGGAGPLSLLLIARPKLYD